MKAELIKAAAFAAAVTVAAGAIPFSASAENDTVFLTMNIPYSDFYAAEVTSNDVSIDAVSSATDAKWKKFPTTYTKENTEGSGGMICGVAFPVAVDADKLSSLKAVNDESADYYFTELSETPAVYKELTVNGDGSYSFSETKGEKNVTDGDGSLSTSTAWGDYLYAFKDAEAIKGDVYGIVLKTDDGTNYGLRHLENIWLRSNEFSWSTGFVTTEPHGNTLSYEHYSSIMGKTINEIEYITTSGVYDYKVNEYVPIKTEGELNVADSDITASDTAVTITAPLPADYDASFAAEDLEASVTGHNDGDSYSGTLTFSNASAGSYTLTMTDKSGKYAPKSASFVLSTDKPAAKYDAAEKKLVPDSDEDAFASFLKNLSTVSVDGNAFSAAGKRGVKIISSEDGTIDLEAETRDGKVFDTEAKDSFELTVSAKGYPDISFTLSLKETEEASDNEDVSSDISSDTDTDSAKDASSEKDTDSVKDTDSEKASSAVSSGKNTSDTSSGKSSSDSSSKSSSYVTSPKTSGRNSIVFPAVIGLSSLAAAFSLRKRKADEE